MPWCIGSTMVCCFKDSGLIHTSTCWKVAIVKLPIHGPFRKYVMLFCLLLNHPTKRLYHHQLSSVSLIDNHYPFHVTDFFPYPLNASGFLMVSGGIERDQWLANCARKRKVPGSSPDASYVQRWTPCSNRPANVYVSVKRVEVVVRS